MRASRMHPEQARTTELEGKKVTIALVLGGGAPNLTLMAGAVAALHDAGVKFDVVSTSGAGMLIGLLYASPKGVTPSDALKNSVNMGVHDAIYDALPVNFKVFHKPGPMAEAYTRFWQTVARSRGDIATLSSQWMDTSLEMLLPGAALAPYRNMWKQFLDTGPAAAGNEDAQRFFGDLTALMLATFCPSDLGPGSKGLCQPAPFVEEAIDFAKLRDFGGEFYMSAYCIDDHKMEIFHKDEIDVQHFQAALAFPLIYAPFKLKGKTYLEGAAKDTLNFKGLYEYRKEEKAHTPIDTIVVCDVLGMEELIGEPRNLYDAWVKSIIVPLVAIAKDDIKLFREVHKPKIPESFGDPEPALLTIDFMSHMPKDHWPNVLDWSYSNLNTLYGVGYKAGRALFDAHRSDLSRSAIRTAKEPHDAANAKAGQPAGGMAGRTRRRGGLEAS
jgi:NTE family protein